MYLATYLFPARNGIPSIKDLVALRETLGYRGFILRNRDP